MNSVCRLQRLQTKAQQGHERHMHEGELAGTPQPMLKPSGRPAVSVVTILILLQVRCTNIMTEQYLFWRHIATGWLAGWLQHSHVCNHT